MQNYPGAIEPKEGNNRNALEILTKGFLLSEPEKLKLLEDLRHLGITDDNDPIVKLTLVQGLYAKYTQDMIRELSYERSQIENSVLNHHNIISSFRKDLLIFKQNIKIWKDESIVEMEKGIEKLKNDKLMLKRGIGVEEKRLENIQRNSIIWILVTLFIIMLSVFFIGFRIKKYQAQVTTGEVYEEYAVIE